MRALLNTCVVMDFLQNREPFSLAAKSIFRAAATDWFNGSITAKSATDIYYLTHRCTHSDKESREKLNQLLTILGLLDTTSEDIFHAISSPVSDFEDAVIIETAIRNHMDCIITRNTKDYAKAALPIYTPDEFLAKLENSPS